MRYLPTLFLHVSLFSIPLPSHPRTLSFPSLLIDLSHSLYPKGSHYFWVINNTTMESREEIIIDINTSIRNLAEDTLTESRFLLLLVEGELFAAQKIPLDANVDCRGEDEV